MIHLGVFNSEISIFSDNQSVRLPMLLYKISLIKHFEEIKQYSILSMKPYFIIRIKYCLNDLKLKKLNKRGFFFSTKIFYRLF